MYTKEINQYYQGFGINQKILDFCASLEVELKERFTKIDQIAEVNQLKVLKAMQDNKLSDVQYGKQCEKTNHVYGHFCVE